MKNLLNRKKIIQYSLLFFLICLTTYLVSTTLDITLIPQIIDKVNGRYIALGAFIIIIYILLESYIINIIINSIQKSKTKFLGFKIATMGLYYNLVTPFASGSQPMQIYSLIKHKVSISKSIAIVTNKTVIFQSIVTIYCILFMVNNTQLLQNEISPVVTMMLMGISMNIISLLIGMIIVLNPKIFKKVVNYIIDSISKVSMFKNLKNKKSTINTQIDDYSYSIRLFLKDKRSLCLTIFLTIIQLTVYFSISYCVYKAFNLNELQYIQLLTLQVFLYICVSPVPTPGNIGANEIGFLTIFSVAFSQELIGYAVFLYVGFTYYLIMITCGIFTIYSHYSINKIEESAKI